MSGAGRSINPIDFYDLSKYSILQKAKK